MMLLQVGIQQQRKQQHSIPSLIVIPILIAIMIPLVSLRNFRYSVYGYTIQQQQQQRRQLSRCCTTLKFLLQQQPKYQHLQRNINYNYSNNILTKRYMSIVDDVTTEMKVAMKAKDTVTLNTIRLIRTAFANAAIELRTDTLTDEQAITTLRKMAKMRKESIDMYETNGAQDRADLERGELLVIEKYLPAAISEDIVRTWIQDAITEVGSYDNIGKVMGAFMKKHKTDVDGTIAQKIAKEEIEKMKQQAS